MSPRQTNPLRKPRYPWASLPTKTRPSASFNDSLDLPFTQEVDIIARNLAMDPLIFYALMRAESGFNPTESPVGARGIGSLCLPALKLRVF